jgi:small subunit ribosomal protein S17
METKTAAADQEFRTARKVAIGVVVSDKMDKTRVVEVRWNTTHPRYRKVLRRSSRFHAHDEKNESHMGDKVEIMGTRPLSRLKRWRIMRVLEKSA